MTEIPEEGEGEEIPDKNYNPEQIFNSEDNIDSEFKQNYSHEIEGTPMFGEDNNSDNEDQIFSNFLWNNEISEKKDIQQSNIYSSVDYIQMSSAKKNICSKIQYELKTDELKIVKIQSKVRQFLAKKKLRALKQIKYIKNQQINISINKLKLLAWRTITNVYLLYKEAKRLVKLWKYLDENSKDANEPMYYQHCQDLKEMNYIEIKFRRCIFRKVREYLKIIPYEWRQSYVKLIDCKIYNREMGNKLRFIQNMQFKKSE